MSVLIKKKKYKPDDRALFFAESLLIIFFSVIIMTIITGFSPNAFLKDDNYQQWLPVIEKTYDTFWVSGHLPQYDFYQLKGMQTADVGYYGYNNVLMFVSYILGRKVFGNINTISVYIFMIYTLGNLIMYHLIRYVKISRFTAAMCTLMYAGSGAYICLSIWYYVWGSYLIIPMLLYSIHYGIKNNSKLSFVLSGIVLTFSLYLGNVQYTFYQYMLYAIVIFCIFLMERKPRNLIKGITNVLTAIVLSGPFLYRLIQAGNRRASVVSGTPLLEYSVSSQRFFVFSALPMFVLNRIFSGDESKIRHLGYEGSFCDVSYSFLFSGFFTITFLVLIILFVYRIISFIEKKNTNALAEEEKTVYSSMIAALFFILFMFGEKGGVALLLSKLPVISGFKYAFKAVFIYIPLLAFVSGYAIEKVLTNRTIEIVIYIIGIIYCFVGIYDNYWILNSNTHSFFHTTNTVDQKKLIDEASEKIRELGVDTANYRIASFMKAENIEDGSPWHQDFELGIRHNGKFMQNMATTGEIFTLGAYEPAINTIAYDQCSRIMSSYYDITRSNSISSFCVIEALENDEEYLYSFTDQIYKNSVKYLIFSKDGTYLNRFLDVCSLHPEVLDVEDVIDYPPYNSIVVLKDIRPLAYDGNGVPLISTSMDELVFNYVNDSEYAVVNMSFIYNDNLRAYFRAGDKRQYLTVTRDDLAYTQISGFPKGIETEVHFEYFNLLELLTVYISVFVSLVLVVSLTSIFFKINVNTKENI